MSIKRETISGTELQVGDRWSPRVSGLRTRVVVNVTTWDALGGMRLPGGEVRVTSRYTFHEGRTVDHFEDDNKVWRFANEKGA
jgi:hypothetical protein